MSRGFLGISLARDVTTDPHRIDRIHAIDSDLLGPQRTLLGKVSAGAEALIVWQRESAIGSHLEQGDARAKFRVGATEGRGIHSTVEIDERGLTATCDLLGFGSLFHWQGQGIAAVSTRPHLIAELAQVWGRPLERRRDIAADLAHLGWLHPNASGWEDLHAVDAGSSVRLADGRCSVTALPAEEGWIMEPPTAAHLDALLEEASSELLDHIDAILDQPFPVVADLTAGVDSRLIVAALAHRDLLDRVELQTIGDPSLHDVVVAAHLADHLGARHRSGFPYPFSMDPFAQRFNRHVEDTGGAANAMEGLRERLEPVDHIRLSGLIGEVPLGTANPLPRDRPAHDVLPRIANAFQAGRLDLLRPAAQEMAGARIDGFLGAAPFAALPAWFATHRFYGEYRLRGRLSRVDDFTPEVRAYPLYSPAFVRAGVAAMWHHPESSLAALLTDRLAPGLNDVAPAAPTRLPTPPTTAPSPTPTTFMQRSVTSQTDTRMAFFASLLDVDSGAWDFIDPDKYRAAIAADTPLGNPKLRLLHGAAGAITWLRD